MHIISITVKERTEEIPDVQRILTDHGKNIISRLGLHNLGKNKNGLIIIVYDGQDVKEFIDELQRIKGIKINSMEVNE